jgi:cyclase
VIARLDVKGPNLVKGWQMEGLRVLGDPAEFARRYADEGADEIVYFDTVASLYGRGNILEIVERTADRVFVPITVGGGVRSIDDVRRLLGAGADKVALNTAALADPALITKLAERVGSQAIVVSIEAKRLNGSPVWEAYTDQGRNRTSVDAVQWAAEAARRGAGEVILTSIDRDGTRKGPDMGLALAVAAQALTCQVVMGGGIGTPAHAVEASGAADAVCIGAALHHGKTTIPAVKAALADAGRDVR